MTGAFALKMTGVLVVGMTAEHPPSPLTLREGGIFPPLPRHSRATRHSREGGNPEGKRCGAASWFIISKSWQSWFKTMDSRLRRNDGRVGRRNDGLPPYAPRRGDFPVPSLSLPRNTSFPRRRESRGEEVRGSIMSIIPPSWQSWFKNPLVFPLEKGEGADYPPRNRLNSASRASARACSRSARSRSLSKVEMC